MKKRNKQYVSLQLEEDEIQNLLNQKLAEHPAKEMLSEALMSIAKDYSSLDILTKALLGLKPMLEYSVGDDVMVKSRGLSDYSFDEPAMIAAGTLIDGVMKCTIIEANPWKHNFYTVEYEYIHKDNQEIRTTTSNVSNSYIVGPDEEFPEDLI